MTKIVILLIFFFNILSCASQPVIANKNIPPSSHLFLKLFNTFINSPTGENYAEIKKYLNSQESMADKYLVSYKANQSLSDTYYIKIKQLINNENVYVVQLLLSLQQVVNTNNSEIESKIVSEKIIDDINGNNRKSFKTGDELLGVYLSTTKPKLLFQAIKNEYQSQVNKDQFLKRITSQIIDYDTTKENLKLGCHICPQSIIEYKKKKFENLQLITGQSTFEKQLHSSITTSELNKEHQPFIFELRSFIADPNQTNFDRFISACYKMSSHNSLKPNIQMLSSKNVQTIKSDIYSGNLSTAQALLHTLNERCWENTDQNEDLLPWLSNLLICHNPDKFISVGTKIKPSILLIDQLFNFESKDSTLTCTGEPIINESILSFRVKKIKDANVSNPLEINFKNFLVSHFESMINRESKAERNPTFDKFK